MMGLALWDRFLQWRELRRKIASAAGVVPPARYTGYKCLRLRSDHGVLFATIDHPPVNMLDAPLIGELDRLAGEMAADERVKVVVFDSADPEIFIAHGEVGEILQMPAVAPPKPRTVEGVHAVFDRYRTLPKVSIAKIEGLARGGGSEFSLALDMRFAAIGKAVFAQKEVGLGLIPGAGGTQRLPRAVGRSRALEVILGAEDFSAELAERYGYVNRALPADELGPFVDALAYRIASFPAEALALAKRAVQAAELPMEVGLLEEAHAFNQAVASPAAREQMARFLELDGQAREIQLNPDLILERWREKWGSS